MAGLSPTATAQSTSATGSPPNFNLTPSTVAGQFPGGIPQVSAGAITGIPSVYNEMGGAGTYSPQSAISATQAYLQPQFQQQDAALSQQLADAGIVGGTGPQAQATLGQQQQTTLQNNIQPYLIQQEGLQQSALQGDQSAFLTGSEANLNSQNQLGEYNTTNLLNTANTDSSAYNSLEEYLAGLQNSDWQAQLGSETAINEAGIGGANTAYQPVYQQPTAPSLGNLASAFTLPTTTAAPAAGSSNYYANGAGVYPQSLANP